MGIDDRHNRKASVSDGGTGITMDLHGASCPICGKVFGKDDDIVFCPDCGTPYHRSCYKEVGHCVREDLHSQGKSWEAPAAPKPVTEKNLAPCPFCGAPNPKDAQRCESCGREIKAAPNPQQTLLDAMNPREDSPIGGIPAQNLVAYTQRNSNYFLRVFRLLQSGITSMVFNWSALLFGPLYYLYRKMNRKGLFLWGLDLLSYLPSFALVYQLLPQLIADPTLMSTMAFQTEGLGSLLLISNLAGYVPIILRAYCGLVANKDYYRHCMERVGALRQAAPDAQQLQGQLLRQGGVNPIGVLFALLFAALSFLLVSAAIVLPYVSGLA